MVDSSNVLFRGPLAHIWRAALWDKGNLSRARLAEIHISESVEALLEHQVRLTLRKKGHLLLGFIIVLHGKARYLLADCCDVLTKAKLVFRPATGCIIDFAP
jgi:cohesin complex subunit SCC1